MANGNSEFDKVLDGILTVGPLISKALRDELKYDIRKAIATHIIGEDLPAEIHPMWGQDLHSQIVNERNAEQRLKLGKG